MNGFIFCDRCNIEIQPQYIHGPFGPHEGKYVCPLCDKVLKWKAKEKNSGKRPKNKYLPSDLGIDYCQLCLRPRHRLGEYETLDSHHVKEIQDGGEDVPENIWVLCTHCHHMVHHTRIYLNAHQAALWEQYEKLKRILQHERLQPEVYDRAINAMKEIIGC